MNRIQRRLAGAFAVILLCAGFVLSPLSVYGEEVSDTVEVIFTHDIHSFNTSYKTEEEGEIVAVGGFARLKTLIDQIKKDNEEPLIVDGGDISMGTLHQVLFETEAIELRMLGRLGVDATTFGNHDFDYGMKAFSNMVQSAIASGERLPDYLICNVDWESQNENSRQLFETLSNANLKKYAVYVKNGVKIGVTGVFGKDALKCAPDCELTILDQTESVAEAVKEMKEKDRVDMVVVISHSGTSERKKASEDELLAKAVPDIDLIISAHSHSTLTKPIVVGDTYIVSGGCYLKKAGYCKLKKNENQRWNMKLYELVDLNERIPEDEEISGLLEGYDEKIEELFLKNYGYKANQVIAHDSIVFAPQRDLEDKHEELPFGSLVADAYRYAVNQTPVGQAHPVDVTVAPSGTIRDVFYPGDITVKDVFQTFSLGIGADKSTGYPLIGVYLTGEELKTVTEIDASISDFMHTARLYLSGLGFSYNPRRILLNKVTDYWLFPNLRSEERQTIQKDQLYHVATDLYSCKMLSEVTKLSKGQISIVPKDENGNAIERFEDHIIYEADGKELKGWIAIAQYLESFEPDDKGIREIPSYYETTHNRQIRDESLSLLKLTKNPNKFTVIILAVVLAALALITLVILLLVRLVRWIIITTRLTGGLL